MCTTSALWMSVQTTDPKQQKKKNKSVYSYPAWNCTVFIASHTHFHSHLWVRILPGANAVGESRIIGVVDDTQTKLLLCCALLPLNVFIVNYQLVVICFGASIAIRSCMLTSNNRPSALITLAGGRAGDTQTFLYPVLSYIYAQCIHLCCGMFMHCCIAYLVCCRAACINFIAKILSIQVHRTILNLIGAHFPRCASIRLINDSSY